MPTVRGIAGSRELQRLVIRRVRWIDTRGFAMFIAAAFALARGRTLRDRDGDAAGAHQGGDRRSRGQGSVLPRDGASVAVVADETPYRLADHLAYCRRRADEMTLRLTRLVEAMAQRGIVPAILKGTGRLTWRPTRIEPER